jgi:hypothetical protein
MAPLFSGIVRLALATARDHTGPGVLGLDSVPEPVRAPRRARGCPRHAVAALDGITSAHVDWADSKGLNEWERKALELSEERNQLPAVRR